MPCISDYAVGRAGNMWVRRLWGDALVTALLYLQFVLPDKDQSPGASTVLELICDDDIFGQGGCNMF